MIEHHLPHPASYHTGTTMITTTAPILLLVAARIVLRVGMRLYEGNFDGGNEASTTESESTTDSE